MLSCQVLHLLLGACEGNRVLGIRVLGLSCSDWVWESHIF